MAVIIPAYNEEKQLTSVVKGVKKKIKNVIVINDGSTDNTKKKIENFKQITLINHKINIGKGAAMKTGAEAAFSMGFDTVIFIDSDGQHNPNNLPKFIDAINDGNDFVLGSRNLSYGVPLVRYLGNKFASILISVMYGIYVSDLLCGYRALTKDAYNKIKWESARYGVETEMIIRCAKNNLKYCEVPVDTIYLDKFKGVTILDAFSILFDVVRWKYSE